MEEANARLLERLARVESNHNAVLSEAQALDSDLRSKSAQNEMLQAQVVQMRASLPVCPPCHAPQQACAVVKQLSAAADSALLCMFAPSNF